MQSHARLLRQRAWLCVWALAAAACTPVEPATLSDPAGPAPSASPEPTASPTSTGQMDPTEPSLQLPDPVAVVLGRVTFSPPGPGPQQAGATPEVAPQLLEGRMVLVFGPGGETLVAEVPVEMDATFRLELAPGAYVIGITLVGIERSESVPVELVLAAGDQLELEIAIDTGLR